MRNDDYISAALYLFAKDREGNWRILCGKRSGTDPRFCGGLMDVPCGMREEGEDIVGTVLRELKEEAGITLKRSDVRFVEPQPWGYGNIGSNFISIADRLLPAGKMDFEHDFFKWIRVEEIDRYQWAFGMGAKARELFDRFVDNGEDRIRKIVQECIKKIFNM